MIGLERSCDITQVGRDISSITGLSMDNIDTQLINYAWKDHLSNMVNSSRKLVLGLIWGQGIQRGYWFWELTHSSLIMHRKVPTVKHGQIKWKVGTATIIRSRNLSIV